MNTTVKFTCRKGEGSFTTRCLGTGIFDLDLSEFGGCYNPNSLALLGNYSLGIEKKGFMLSGQVGNVNLCDEPTIKRSFPNLDYTLKGYNYLKGFPISLEHDPGFSHQIFQVLAFGEKTSS